MQPLQIKGRFTIDKALGTLWDYQEPYDVTLANIGQVRLPAETKFEELTGKVGSVAFYEATAKKFAFVPAAGVVAARPGAGRGRCGRLVESLTTARRGRARLRA